MTIGLYGNRSLYWSVHTYTFTLCKWKTLPPFKHPAQLGVYKTVWIYVVYKNNEMNNKSPFPT